MEEAAGRQWHERYPAADREKLRQQSMELPGAKDVFTVIPEDTNWGLPIRGSAWRAAIAGWLGLPHGKLVVRECQGRHQSCRRHGAEWDHHQSCVQINGKAKKTRRHDGVVNSLAWCLRSGLGLNPQVEPNNLDNVGRRRPDILVSLGEKQYLVDVAVVQSFGAGQVETGRVGAKYLEAAERRKREHYADIAVEFQAEVVHSLRGGRLGSVGSQCDQVGVGGAQQGRGGGLHPGGRCGSGESADSLRSGPSPAQGQLGDVA